MNLGSPFRLVAVGLGAAGALALGRGAGEPADPTWADSVAPLVRENCVGCHNPNGSAPFSLLTYADARRRADRIVRATAEGAMPPWLPAPLEIGTFVGERRLSAEQTLMLRRWVDAGMPAGDTSQLAPMQPSAAAWELGAPDLVLRVPTFSLPVEREDVYRNLVVPIPVGSPRFVTTVELKPAAGSAVHHARMMIDTTRSSRALDSADVEPGFDGMELISGAGDPQGHFLGWTPGKGALPPLEDLAWRLEPGTDLVVQLHMRATGQPETVDAEVGFYFTDHPPSAFPALLKLRSLMIDIPPGESEYRVTQSYTLPVSVDVLSVYPHAHYLGKRLRALAELPGGRLLTLIDIPSWDFNWQDDYRFSEPVRLPRGTVLSLDYVFDNSASNPNNPADPPVRVVYGSKATDEMAELTLQVLPADASQRDTLMADFAWHEEVHDMTYMAERSFLLGQQRFATGDFEAAVTAFQDVLQYRTDHPAALTGLGRAFLAMGDGESARLAGERAVTLAGGASSLFLLAEAYGVLGDPRAEQVARAALSQARAESAPALADSIRSRFPGVGDD